MTIKIPKETEKQLIVSIKRFFEEMMSEEIGDLRASLVLDFCLSEIGPVIYNRAISDAQSYMQEKAVDMDGSCYEPEFEYWKKK